ncbi:MAG: hypothetical protein ACXVCP_00405 [Bdellovibrio sp.]
MAKTVDNTSSPPMDVQKYLAEKNTASANPPMSVAQYLQEKQAKAAAEPVDNRSALQVYNDAMTVTNWPKYIENGLHKIDEYTGAPVRKFVTEKLTGQEFKDAPTGTDQAKMLGASDVTYGDRFNLPKWVPGRNISPANIYGTVLETVQDPFLIAGEATQGIKKAIQGGEALAEATRGRQFVESTQRQAAGAAADSSAKASAQIAGGGVSVEQGGKLFSVQQPKSLEELRQWKPAPNVGELPGKARLQQIEQTVPDLQTKPLKYHYDMMENPKAMKDLKLQFENLPTADAKKIAAYNQTMVDESGKKIQSTVRDISPAEPRTLTEAGDDLISTIKEKYNSEKEALGPVFQDLQKSKRLSRDETMDLARGLAENTKLGKLMDIGEDGKLYLKPNTPRTGISDAEHNVLSRVISDMNEGMTFKEMQDTRDFLRKSMDQTNPAATSEIAKVRSIMLGQMEEMASKNGAKVGDTFKRYAMNERARENVEHIIGGKIESLDSMFAANPDRAVKKIFSNPNYAKVVGDYVGPDKMAELVQSYIENGIRGAYDSAKGFDPSAVRSWLKTNQTFMQRYAPQTAQRLSALADYGYYGKRFLDEVNPSGTAASLLQAIKPAGFFQKVKTDGIIGAISSETAGRVASKVTQNQATKALNESLGAKNISATDSFKSKILNSNISDKIKNARDVTYSGSSVRNLIKSNPSSGVNAKDNTKGPEKWANDGIEMILQSDQANIDRATLEKLKSTQKGKELLFEASTAKNKKAMENVIKKIRTATNNGVD